MNVSELTHDNWLFFAISNYVNSSSVTYEEFEEDLNRFKYIKRLFKRYETYGELKSQLIINHLIMTFNSFDDAAVPLLFYKIDQRQHPILKSFLLFLGKLPDILNNNIDKTCLSLLTTSTK